MKPCRTIGPRKKSSIPDPVILQRCLTAAEAPPSFVASQAKNDTDEKSFSIMLTRLKNPLPTIASLTLSSGTPWNAPCRSACVTTTAIGVRMVLEASILLRRRYLSMNP